MAQHHHIDVHARGERLISLGYFYLGAGAVLLIGFALTATGSGSRVGIAPSQTEQVSALLTAAAGLLSAIGGFIALRRGRQDAGR